jgi:short-subunit dehydrogenase
MRIRGRVALVTGASSGIGWATAVRLAEAGARVIVHGRDSARLSALADLVGGVPVTGDLADPVQVDRLTEAALDVAGRIDIMVNNAGVGWAGPFDQMPAQDVARLIAVNLAAPIELTRAVLPTMRARGDGYVMFVTSIAGRVGVAGEAVYAATKAGLDAFAESLRLELIGSGVGVGVLAPGVVATAFFERRGRPYTRGRPRPVPADRVADVLVRAIAAGHAERYVPGWLRLPVAVRGAAPGVYRCLAGRFGGSA